jgi:hypothetical protein
MLYLAIHDYKLTVFHPAPARPVSTCHDDH